MWISLSEEIQSTSYIHKEKTHASWTISKQNKQKWCNEMLLGVPCERSWNIAPSLKDGNKDNIFSPLGATTKSCKPDKVESVNLWQIVDDFFICFFINLGSPNNFITKFEDKLPKNTQPINSGFDPTSRPTVAPSESGWHWALHISRCCRRVQSRPLPRQWLCDQTGDQKKLRTPYEAHWRSHPTVSWCSKCFLRYPSVDQINANSACSPAHFRRWWDQTKLSFQCHFLQRRSTFRLPEQSSWTCQIHELGHTSNVPRS